MQDFILNRDFWSSVNLFSETRKFDDFSLISLCKMAVDNRVFSVSVPAENVDSVWEWLELSDVKLCAVINNYMGKMSVEDMFRRIKAVVNNGADIVEVALPKETFDVDVENIPPQLDDMLCAISEAKGVKKIKVTMETAWMKNSSKLKGVIYLLSKYKVDIVKTASGNWEENSRLEHLNAILEEAKSSGLAVDFIPELYMDKSNKFIFDDAGRLGGYILGVDEAKNGGLTLSCSMQEFSKIIAK